MRKSHHDNPELFIGFNPPLNMKIILRFIIKSFGTPFEHVANRANNDEPICFDNKSVVRIASSRCYYWMAVFIRRYQAYIMNVHQILPESEKWLESPTMQSFIETEGKSNEELIEIMEARMQCLVCMDDLALIQMDFLIQARVNSLLLAKYWKQIPNGAAEKTLAENVFEELCANSKLPRRTAAIINKRKEREQAAIDELNNSLKNQNETSEDNG